MIEFKKDKEELGIRQYTDEELKMIADHLAKHGAIQCPDDGNIKEEGQTGCKAFIKTE